jgi:hypothetical protein
MLADAIQAYHDLLQGDLAAASQEHLEAQLRRRNLLFGDRMVCSVLRPRFLTLDQYRFLRTSIRPLLRAFAKVNRAALQDAGFRRQFGLTPVEEDLLTVDANCPCPYPTSRLDAFFVSEQELKFTEYNSETPAGAGYNDAISEAFIGMPALREFSRRFQTLPLPTRPHVLRGLIQSFQQWRGRRESPRIGIVDWREVPTYREFELFQDYFRAEGLECVIADPHELEYRHGQLWAGDFAITLIYKRVLLGELLDRGGLEHPLVRAVRDGAVCMLNGFGCKPLYKKASFAVLTDERNAAMFSPEELEAIQALLPWTRLVEERMTHRDGAEIDLLPHLLQNRERLVLKPNDEYGGKGVVLGWTVSAVAWEQAVQIALAAPYVVQERLNIPSEVYPSWGAGHVEFIPRMLDTNPYVCHGEYVDGCLTRISTAALLNVTAGTGSTVPTFLVEPR